MKDLLFALDFLLKLLMTMIVQAVSKEACYA